MLGTSAGHLPPGYSFGHVLLHKTRGRTFAPPWKGRGGHLPLPEKGVRGHLPLSKRRGVYRGFLSRELKKNKKTIN